MRKLVLGLVGLSLFSLGALSVAQAEDSSISWWEKTRLSGNFNTTYNYNFNNPPLGVGNAARVFDVRHNDFDINRAELEIENSPAEWAKFRMDIAFGEDVAIVDGLKGGVIGADEVGIQQAYVALTAPVGNGLTFTAGHFATLIGAEVIESAYNFNTSRSFLFGFAIPFTHTGVYASYDFNDWFSASLGVVNGWDTVTDLNKAKTALWQLGFTPSDTLSFSFQGTMGPDADASIGVVANDSDWLALVDFVLTWQPVEEFVFQINGDWANQQDAGSKTADWWGVALLANYDFNDLFGLTVRGEMFDDNSGFRFGGGTNHNLYEGTITAHFYMNDGFEARLEGRHDHSDRAFFVKANGTTRKYQDTVSAELLYKF